MDQKTILNLSYQDQMSLVSLIKHKTLPLSYLQGKICLQSDSGKVLFADGSYQTGIKIKWR